MNKKELTKLRIKAKLTLKILDLLEKGLSNQEIVKKLAIERPLVVYYRNLIEA